MDEDLDKKVLIIDKKIKNIAQEISTLRNESGKSLAILGLVLAGVGIIVAAAGAFSLFIAWQAYQKAESIQISITSLQERVAQIDAISKETREFLGLTPTLSSSIQESHAQMRSIIQDLQHWQEIIDQQLKYPQEEE